MPVINKKGKIIDLRNYQVTNVYNVLLHEKADKVFLNIKQWDFLLSWDNIRQKHLDLCTVRDKILTGYYASFVNGRKKTEIWLKRCQ